MLLKRATWVGGWTVGTGDDFKSTFGRHTIEP